MPSTVPSTAPAARPGAAATAIRPVSVDSHRGKRWRPVAGYAHARGDEVVPLAAAEPPRAALHLVLSFVGRGESWLPAAVLGLEPGRNAYVGAAGDWQGGYIPETFRVQPFRLGRTQDGKAALLCIDEAAALAPAGAAGEDFFAADGKLAPAVQEKFDLLGRIEAGRRRAAAACAVLARHALIQPWPLVIKTATGERPVSGLFRIDEPALNKLPAQALLELRDSGALLMAYCQLLSMQNLHSLGRLVGGRAERDPAAPGLHAGGELDLEFLNRGGTLSLSGL